MANYKFSYHSKDPEHLIDFESEWSEGNLEYVSEDAAEYFYSHCDGWESSWPVKFFIFDNKDKFLGAYEVGVDYDPVFRASFDRIE